jgi:squalene synthase HpnC
MLLVSRAAGTTDRGLRDASHQAKEQAENFPVAFRLLPRARRQHLRAVYDVVRTIDDLGDEATGDRTALLTAFQADLATVWQGGRPQAVVLRRLQIAVAEAGLTQQPFDDLVAANLQDQRITGYATRVDLLGYCALSANPIGRLVLQVFDADSEQHRQLSDQACTALQLLEHWQDVAEDRRAGRVYLPVEDLTRHGVSATDLDASRSTPQVTALIAAETRWADELLEAGSALVPLLRGWARVAVSGYVAGGRATVQALQRPGVDVLATTPRPRRADQVRHGLSLVARGR